MKFIRLLMVVAFLGISATAALADGVPNDPILLTAGCGRIGQPKCDAVVLTPDNTTVTVTEKFTCNDVSGNCTAQDTVINLTGVELNNFTLLLNNPANPPSFIYSCGTGAQFFNCFKNGPTSFTFSGNTLCADPDSDLVEGTFVPDGDECGVIIGLSGTKAEGIMTGTTVIGTASFSAPEPSSALLLVFGLMAGLVGLKSFRGILS